VVEYSTLIASASQPATGFAGAYIIFVSPLHAPLNYDYNQPAPFDATSKKKRKNKDILLKEL